MFVHANFDEVIKCPRKNQDPATYVVYVPTMPDTPGRNQKPIAYDARNSLENITLIGEQWRTLENRPSCLWPA